MENPLDILTRAASLVEKDSLETHCDDSILHPEDNRDSPGKELPTKTQRQQRSLSRQGMPEQLNFDEDHQNMLNSKKTACTQTSSTVFDQYKEVRKHLTQSVPPSSHLNHAVKTDPNTKLDEMPLNLTMNVQDDATNDSPPTYTQLRPSVIMCAPVNMPPLSPGGSTGSSIPSSPSPTSPNGPNKRDSNSAGICDPAIDEHFRRSLGKNYPEYSPSTPTTTSTPLPNLTQSQPEVSISGTVDDHFAKSLGQKWTELKAKNDNLDMDIFTGSVDDHFAKALGDTWHKIKAQHDGCKNSACSSPPSSPSSSVVST